jgi:hypothetical protein
MPKNAMMIHLPTRLSTSNPSPPLRNIIVNATLKPATGPNIAHPIHHPTYHFPGEASDRTSAASPTPIMMPKTTRSLSAAE